MNINRIQLKVLLLDSITRLKYGSANPLVRTDQNPLRRELKKLTNLKSNCPEEEFLTIIAAQYEYNGLIEDFMSTMKRFGLEEWVTAAE